MRRPWRIACMMASGGATWGSPAPQGSFSGGVGWISHQSPRDAATVISGPAPGDPAAGISEIQARLYPVLKKPSRKPPRKSGGRGSRAGEPDGVTGVRGGASVTGTDKIT
jgi:hypothetical protein